MLTLVTGGSASGKSEYAERLVLSRSGDRPRIYLATMEPAGEEAKERIARHRAMREGRGFQTVECARNLREVLVPGDSTVLLEDLGNLVANELFGNGREAASDWRDSPDSEQIRRILDGIRHLRDTCAHLTIVTNEVFSGGQAYEGDTLRYLRILACVNAQLAKQADRVVEVVCGIPVLLEECGKNRCVPAEGPKEPAAENRKKGEPQYGALQGTEKSDYCGKTCCREEERMLFVTGPLCAGKQEYVMRTLGWKEADFAANAVRDVQVLAAGIVQKAYEIETRAAQDDKEQAVQDNRELTVQDERELTVQDEREPAAQDDKKRAAQTVQNTHEIEDEKEHEKEYVKELVQDPVKDHVQEELCRLADTLAAKQVVIATEVGGGVVPLDPVQRREREAAGRLACLLAERAQTVVRVNCGLPQVLKGTGVT